MSSLLKISYRNEGFVVRTITKNKSRFSNLTSPISKGRTRTAGRFPISSLQKGPNQHQVLRACAANALAEKISDITTETPKYRVQEHPLGKLRPLKVAIFGAGVNGLNMLYTLQKQTKDVECVVYEKNPECGGTWFENRYPGCASDDPSHHYQYTHSLNPSWSSVFAPAGEIRQYLNDFIDRNDLRSSVFCGSSVSSSVWDEDKSKWMLKIKSEATGTICGEEADVIVDATGIFNDIKWPLVEGLKSFKGVLIHTAKWPSAFKYNRKKVAVLGNGASGVQIVPAIQPHVEKLVHCIRSKTWIEKNSESKSLKTFKGHFIPKPWGKIPLPSGTSRELASAFYQLKLGHGYLQSYLSRLGITENIYCTCGSIETARHLILYCTEYRRQRKELLARIKKETSYKEITLPILFHTKEGIKQLLVFLKETSICTRRWHLEREEERLREAEDTETESEEDDSSGGESDEDREEDEEEAEDLYSA